jgi:WD40 repeat protein
VERPPCLNTGDSCYISSLSFSSSEGGKAILAVGRSSGRVVLYGALDKEEESRFNSRQPNPVSCLSFRPTVVKRPSSRDPNLIVETEDLLVGDEIGHVYFYSVEWPTVIQKDVFDWPGCLTLLARTTVHSQQICGLSWSPDGESFATGGNDNFCHLFDTRRIMNEVAVHSVEMHHLRNYMTMEKTQDARNVNLASAIFNISSIFSRHCFEVAAAVKAIAFCP